MSAETQRMHAKILNHLMKPGAAPSSSVELPELVKIPLTSDEDVALLDKQLKDATTLKCLVKLYFIALMTLSCIRCFGYFKISHDACQDWTVFDVSVAQRIVRVVNFWDQKIILFGKWLTIFFRSIYIIFFTFIQGSHWPGKSRNQKSQECQGISLQVWENLCILNIQSLRHLWVNITLMCKTVNFMQIGQTSVITSGMLFFTWKSTNTPWTTWNLARRWAFSHGILS